MSGPIPMPPRMILVARRTHRARPVLVLLFLSLMLSGGCAYFNTYYHAKKAFDEGEATRKSSSQQGAPINAGKVSYERAIEKANKIVEKHPKSSWHDDALFLIGVSYFRINNFTKSEAAFRALLEQHPKSDLAEESQLYLARCRIELGDEISGYNTFSTLAQSGGKRAWRAEATFQCGEHFFRNEMYDSSARAYERVYTEFKESERDVESRQRAADALRHLGQSDSAITLYASLVENKHPLVRFEALRGMGEALYEAKRPDSGIAVFENMIEKEDYADSIGTIRLLLAHGLQETGDVDGAWRQYEQVAALLEHTKWSAEALFRMAEIKQFREKDLVRAKDLYEKSREENAVGNLAQLALTRSANITKLEQFRKELGRGQLNPSERSRAEGELYDPDRLPLFERLYNYSPLEARPPDYEVPSPPDTTSHVFGPELPPNLARADSSKQTGLEPFGPPSSAGPEPLGPPASAGPEPFGPPASAGPETFGPPVASNSEILGPGRPANIDSIIVAEQTQGPPSSLIPYYGPPLDSADLAYNVKVSRMLTDADWHSVLGTALVYGPPPPAYLYEYGRSSLLGPVAPVEAPQPPKPVVAEVDSTALQAKAERDSVKAAHLAELEKVKSAANMQMQLAELYRFNLGYPDSALNEYDNLASRYEKTPYAAKALLGAADVLMESMGDTAGAQDRLHRILTEYPHSDYAGDAIIRLHLEGTPADTGHPRLAYFKIEQALHEDRNSKRTLQQLEDFIEAYPESRLVPNAEYAIAQLREAHFAVDDSSIIQAYKDIAAKYPNTVFATAATEKLTYTVKRPPKRVVQKIQDTTAATASKLASTDPDSLLKKKTSSLPKAPTKIKTKGEFIYPESEISKNWKGKVVFRIEIDYLGNIVQSDILGKSGSSLIDEAAKLAVDQTKFFFDSIPRESLNMPYLYELDVIPPGQALNQQNQLGVPPFDPNRP